MTMPSRSNASGQRWPGDTAAFYEADLTMPVGEHTEREKAAADGFLDRDERSGQRGVRWRSCFRPEEFLRSGSTHRLARLHVDRTVVGLTGRRGAANMKATGQPGPEIAGLKITGTETGRMSGDLDRGARSGRHVGAMTPRRWPLSSVRLCSRRPNRSPVAPTRCLATRSGASARLHELDEAERAEKHPGRSAPELTLSPGPPRRAAVGGYQLGTQSRKS